MFAVPSSSLKYVGMVVLHQHTEPGGGGWRHWLLFLDPAYQDTVPKNEAVCEKHKPVCSTPATNHSSKGSSSNELIVNPVKSHHRVSKKMAQKLCLHKCPQEERGMQFQCRKVSK